MDTFFSIGQLSNNNLLSVNHCQLAKRALTVADVYTGDGTAIQCDTLLLQVAPYPSNLIWQHEQPSHKNQKIWAFFPLI